MRILIFENQHSLSKWIAHYIVRKINLAKPSKEKPFVLGLSTGTSLIGIYSELVSLYDEGKVSFQNVVTFNMYEYVEIAEENSRSCHYFMWQHLFSQIDIPKANINILNGNAKDLEKECEDYEERIKSFGGIDIFLCDIGEDGHIGFNEPGSSLSSRTRLKTLTYETRIANAHLFNNDVNKVPKTALTVGVATVMDSKEVLIIVSGYTKARALKMAVEEGVNHMWTVSMLQLHPHGIIACDEDATAELKVRTVKYFKEMESIYLNKLPEL